MQSGTYVPFTGNGNSTAGSKIWTFNFGQDSTFAGATTAGGNQDANGIGDFKYAPPAGYLALCTANLPTPTIVDGSEHFNTVLYTGDGTASHDISGVGFSPDFIWIKSRSNTYNHQLQNTVAGITKTLLSDATNAETPTPRVNSVSSDGFNVYNSAQTNGNNSTFVAWNWKAGGTAVSNTDGSITSQVSANVDAGFSIVSYVGNSTSGATIGHGLSSAPEMLILKNRDSASLSWPVYHAKNTSAPETDYLYLNHTQATVDQIKFWNDTAPTSTVFSIGDSSTPNSNGAAYIAYCFHSVDGYSKVGSYTGNGSSDGPFVFTGFRPAWVMVKRTDSTADWYLYDAKRNAYNLVNGILQPNESDAEATSSNNSMDFTSNGFKLRGSGATINASGGTFIYLAFAESPFKYANAR